MSGKHGKFKRREIRELIQKEYGLKIYNMHERDKGILIYTDQGDKFLKRMKKDEAQVLFVASAYEHIKSRGFENISALCKTLEGKYYIKYDGSLYALEDSMKGKHFSISSHEDGEKIGKVLAEYHIAADNFVPAAGSRAKVDWGRWMDKIKVQSVRLKKFRETVEEKKIKNKFDRLFIKHVDLYEKRAEEAYSLLKESCYMEKVYKSMQTNQLCHKTFKKHSLILTDRGDIFITAMENCSYDIIETDLVSLLESCIGSKGLPYLPSVIQGYSQVKPLDADSLNIIRALLLQPGRFYKIVNRYYGKKKNYNEYELMKKMERSLRKEERRYEIVKKLEEVMK
ncbi:MAG: CotS family spore coat protein [Clostridiales bacterium]|nr:CotS family spore coat protein [Clostridiales bacterium]